MRSFRRVAYIRQNELQNITGNNSEESSGADERIRELAEFLTAASLPFTPADKYEYWLLDPKDDAPLALIFPCTEEEQMSTFP